MSAVPPVHPVDRRSPNYAGFNEQSYVDPVLPVATGDEYLLQTPAGLSQSYSGYSASPSPQPSHHSGATAEDAQVFPPAVFDLSSKPSLDYTDYSHMNYNHTELPPTAYSRGQQHALNLEPQGSGCAYTNAGSYNPLTDFSDDIKPTTDFSLFPDSDFQSILPSTVPPPDHKPSDPESATTAQSTDTGVTHKFSLGTATHSSTLMSPVLTDRASPASRDGRPSPGLDTGLPEYHQSFGMGDGRDQNPYPMQHTPTLTSSSMGTSPDRTTMSNAKRAPSPMVRIESYTRGDSPARPSIPLGRSSSKRSRGDQSPLHLAVQDDGDGSTDDEPDDDPDASYVAANNVNTQANTARVGLNPSARLNVDTAEVPNFRDQDETANVTLKNADVTDWLLKNDGGDAEAVNDAPVRRPRRTSGTQRRRRARSTGDHALSQDNLQSLQSMPADMHIPGPGVLLNVEVGDDDYEDSVLMSSSAESADVPGSPPTTIQDTQEAREGIETDERSSPPPLYRLKFWQDPIYDSSDPGVRMQPPTSNQAAMRWQSQVKDTDALSRVATWGTRRMSEGDLSGLLHRFTFGRQEEVGKGKVDRQSSLFEQMKAQVSRTGSRLKRSGSKSTRHDAPKESMPQLSREESNTSRKESLGLPTALARVSSLGKRPKTPRVDTGSAVAAMASMASLGAGVVGPSSATATSPPMSSWGSTKAERSRARSRSELGDLWTKQGGPPMPKLTTPKEESYIEQRVEPTAGFEEEDDDEMLEGKGVTMDLAPRSDPIIPNIEGFKAHARQLNPRLPPYMVDRVAQEQLRRYKKLLEFKVKHSQAIKSNRCTSGKHCHALGGEPTYLPSKASLRDSELTNAGFSVGALGNSDEEDANALAEGMVTPAQFPPGVPMPPVKRLPAEFECSLCFKVKKFQKPSDWSKHVHEDVQPFTCTFANCAEPKSFKRKADWVRHENERHRQLEWWDCDMSDCTHKCFRKDNFVQHLVREHKLPEPKLKTAKASKPAVRGPSSQKARKRMGEESPDEELDQVWRLVDKCRGETTKDPRDEPCKFCGNICNSWKKLTVHLARHMEQIAMPVLDLAKQREVSHETIISPVEQKASSNTKPSPSLVSQFSPDQMSRAPYAVPNAFYNSPPTQRRAPQGHTAGGPVNTPYPRQGLATYPPPQMQPSVQSKVHQQMVDPYNMRHYTQYQDQPLGGYHPVNEPRHPIQAPMANTENHLGRGEVSRPQQSAAPLYPVREPFSTYTSQPYQSPTESLEASMYAFPPGTSQTFPQPGMSVHFNQMGQYVPTPQDPNVLYESGMGQGHSSGQGYPYP